MGLEMDMVMPTKMPLSLSANRAPLLQTVQEVWYRAWQVCGPRRAAFGIPARMGSLLPVLTS